MSEEETSDALAALLRWEASGATWIVRSAGGEVAVVDLLTCDGGEVMGKLVSSDPGFMARVRGNPGR